MTTIKRFSLGRSFNGGVGMPAVTEHPEGEFVRYADHQALLAAFEAHNEMLLARTKRAEDKLCKSEN